MFGQQGNRGRCYDHNFWRFLPIFGEKLAFFSKTNATYNQKFALFSFVFSQKAPFFRNFFGKNIFKIITSVPGMY
jgi:hypothetical protein